MSNTSLLHDAYKQYQSAGFVLQRAVKNKKFSSAEGSLKDRVNHEWSEKATGYVAIIPPNIIIVDDDSYKDPTDDSFIRMCDDLGIDADSIKPFALTPSGGKHYAFENPNTDLVIGNLTDKYPLLDIYAGYQSVIPIVGTQVFNKQGELNTYTWYDEIDGLYVNPYVPTMEEVFEMRIRGESNGEDFDESGFDLAIKEQELPTAEVRELIERIPPDFEYDDWLKVGIALYERFEGNDEGLEIFQRFGERCTREGVNDPENAEKKWRAGHFKSDGRISYKTLRSLARLTDYRETEQNIRTATSEEELASIVEDIATRKYHSTPDKKTVDVLDEYSELINSRYKELKKTNPSIKVVQARTLRKEMEYVPSEEEIGEEIGTDVKIYLNGTRYVLQIGKKLIVDITLPTAMQHLINSGISSGQAKKIIDGKKTSISGINITTDYMLGKDIDYRVEDAEEIERMPLLVARKDPFHDVTDYINDEEIINDFVYNIWNGKVIDIVEIIALSIKFKEQKLNRLMTVAPSNTGKTELYEMMGFQKITMKRLLNGLRGDKGIGTKVIEGIKHSGLLLVDEANKTLEQEIKDLDKYLYVDEFGAGGGTQKIKLHFTALTSTHKTATRNNSDELYNRFLQVELTQNESKYHVTQSPIFQKDSERYSTVVSSFMRYHFKQCLLDDKYDKEYLARLQSKYRLPLNNDLDEFLYDVSIRVIENIESLASEEGDVVNKQGVYYIKRKGDLSAMVEDMLKEVSSIDHGKYTEKIVGHFTDGVRRNVKINGKVVGYYEVNLRPFTQDSEKLVQDEFDDLDADDKKKDEDDF